MKKFPIRSMSHFKRFAGSLKKELDLSHSHCLERLAVGLGYANYKEILDEESHQRSEDCDFALLPHWLSQVNDAFRTELGPSVGRYAVSDWFRRICGAGGSSREFVDDAG